MDPEIPRPSGDRPRFVGVHAAKLSAGAGGVFPVAPGRTQISARLGKTSARRFSRLPAVCRAESLEPRGDAVALFRIADVLQVFDAAGRGRKFADQEPFAAETGKTAAPVHDQAANAGFAGRAHEAVGDAGAEEGRGTADLAGGVCARCRRAGDDLFLRLARE